MVVLQPEEYQWPQNIMLESLPRVKPPVSINTEHIVLAAERGLSWDDLAVQYLVDAATLQRRFDVYYKQGLCNARDIILSAQMLLAKKGNKDMLIWLGKTRLGQGENTATNNNSSTTPEELHIELNVVENNTPERAALEQELEEKIHAADARKNIH